MEITLTLTSLAELTKELITKIETIMDENKEHHHHG